MNETVKSAIKITTIVGGAVVAGGAVYGLATTPFTWKKSIMPVVTIIVGLSALTYGLSDQGGELKLLPKA